MVAHRPIEWADGAKTIPAGVRITKASGKRQFTLARGPWQVFIAIACHWQANAEKETSGRRPSFSSGPRATSARERSVRSRASTPVRSSRTSYGAVGAVALFVFRRLEVDDAFAVTMPGVRPRVQPLMELGTAGRIRLARSLFAFLLRTGRDPSALPDIFYVRVSAALGGRLPGHKVLLSLLAGERRSRARESSAASKAKSVASAPPAPSTRALGGRAASTGKPC